MASDDMKSLLTQALALKPGEEFMMTFDGVIEWRVEMVNPSQSVAFGETEGDFVGEGSTPEAALQDLIPKLSCKQHNWKLRGYTIHANLVSHKSKDDTSANGVLWCDQCGSFKSTATDRIYPTAAIWHRHLQSTRQLLPQTEEFMRDYLSRPCTLSPNGKHAFVEGECWCGMAEVK